MRRTNAFERSVAIHLRTGDSVVDNLAANFFKLAVSIEFRVLFVLIKRCLTEL